MSGMSKDDKLKDLEKEAFEAYRKENLPAMCPYTFVKEIDDDTTVVIMIN